MTDSIHIHYAVQTCDQKSWQGRPRICGDDRTLLSKKSLVSLFESIENCVKRNSKMQHNVVIIDDHSSAELIDFLAKCQQKYSSDYVKIELQPLQKTGIRNSIQACYEWMSKNGQDLVYQVQDDYLFAPTAIYDVIDIFYQMLAETKIHAVISPFNDAWLWLTAYRNRTTPRAVIVGGNDYWIQYYDMSCSFLTSHAQFIQHWDLYNIFFNLIDKIDHNRDSNGKSILENKSLNYMLTQRNVLGLVPVRTLAHHMQTEQDVDPFAPWQLIWDKIDVNF